MTEPTDAEFPPLKDVTLRIDDRPLVITVADARQIARALQRYLDAHEATGDGMPLPRAAGQPWVDTRGALRIGTWILESRADRLVLTMRSVPQPGATSGSQLIAAVARIENDWRVDEITLARIRYR